MGGAYTANPGPTSTPTPRPPGWPESWPFPGPLPPGYDPTYGLSIQAPPTPEDVEVDEEITVKVFVYQEGLGDPPSKLGTIAPDTNISWTAILDGFVIAESSEGWTYISGKYYSSWTFTPPLDITDVTDPAKIMTVNADGIMNNGSFSSLLTASEEIDVVGPTYTGLAACYYSGSPVTSVIVWHTVTIRRADSSIFFEGIWKGSWNDTIGLSSVEYLPLVGTMPEGTTVIASLISTPAFGVLLTLEMPNLQDDLSYEFRVDAFPFWGTFGGGGGYNNGDLSTGSSQAIGGVVVTSQITGTLEVELGSGVVSISVPWGSA